MTPEEVIRDIQKKNAADKYVQQKIDADVDVRNAFENEKGENKNALKELSAGLYSRDTQFLHELIQNADDNRYDQSKQPTLHFILANKGGHFGVNCNEVGFSEQNVRAICTIGGSTKEAGRIGGCIGGKGIGFKAVFKAANMVFIRSNGYEFYFDASGSPRGMKVPKLKKFPGRIVKDWTQYLLHLKSASIRQDLLNYLTSMNPTMLLFLQRLQTIKLDLPDASTIFTCERGTNGSTASLVTRVNRSDGEWTESSKAYLKVEEIITDLPEEERRPNIDQTKVILAFPQDNEPSGKSSQFVYAFLPISDFGLQFLVQADFLTTSNREDISDCAWNQALRQGVAKTLLSAVREMNGQSELTYAWPQYLRSLADDSMPQSFLSPLAGKSGLVCELLRKQPILRDRSKRLKKPTELLWVPNRFLTRDGSPLLDNFEGLSVLSTDYDKSCDCVLRFLGVTELDEDLFVRKLGQMGHSILKAKTQQWHKDLAKCINEMSSERLAELNDVPLIPLIDGTWIAGNVLIDRKAFFDNANLKLAAPIGTDLQIVKKKAATDEDRRMLMKNLGVTVCTAANVCNAILDYHKDTDQPTLLARLRDPQKPHLLAERLIDHAVYLFTYREHLIKSSPLGSLWLADSNASCAHASDLYVDIPGSPFAISKVLHDDDHTFPFLHSGYLIPSSMPQKKSKAAFLTWLHDLLGVRSIPRLVTRTTYVTGDGTEQKRRLEVSLSAEFEQIIASNPSSIFLSILIKNWDYYYGKGDAKLAVKVNSIPILRDLSHQEVDSSEGRRPLNATVLPIPKLQDLALKLEITNVPWLTIDLRALKEKDVNVQKVLKYFGVCVTKCSDFFFTLLKGLQSRAPIPEKQVETLYGKLSKFLVSAKDQEAGLVKSVFEQDPMILAYNKLRELDWVCANQCVWRGPSTLRSKYALQPIYPDCEPLFSRVLGLEDTTFTTLVDDLMMLLEDPPSEDLVDSVKSIILNLPAHKTLTLKDECRDSGLLEPDQPGFLPIRQPGSGTVTLETASSTFFIADDLKFRKIFGNHVQLLDFTVDELRTLRGLLEALGLKEKYLKTATYSNCVASDDSDQDTHLTQCFQRKALDLYRCFLHFRADDIVLGARHKEGTRRHLFWHLANLYVFRAEQVTVIYEVESLKTSQCPEAVVYVSLHMFNKRLYLYLPRDVQNLSRAQSYTLPHAFCEHLCLSGQDAHAAVSYILACDGAASSEFLDEMGVERLPAEILDELQSDMNPSLHEFGRPDPMEGQSLGAPGVSEASTAFDSHQYGNLNDVKMPDAEGESLFFPLPGDRSVREPVTSMTGNAAFLSQLFVVKQLQLALPDFDPETHWTNPMRTKACSLSGYDSLSEYTGMKLADIVYPDSAGHMAVWLQSQIPGFAQSSSWSTTNAPTYFIRILGTREKEDEAEEFYMSATELLLAESMLKEAETTRRVYAIFRVTGIGKPNCGISVYIDPATMVHKKELEPEAGWMMKVVTS